jgi:HAD superfamily hydrolase (TIGR01484 family)
MRYFALACDYDGTIAWDGVVSPETVTALENVRKSGRKLILVTGRELPDLIRVFPRLDLFDRVVAENGALIYRPTTKEERILAEAPPPAFAEELKARGAQRVSVGRVIVATWTPSEVQALEAIREMGLELQIIFNKGAVMILPSGVNKATGLTAALEELGLSTHNVVGVGDAENDHAFMSACECSVAVANALDMLKERVDWVTQAGHGEGVTELINLLVTSDLVEVEERLHRFIPIGKRSDDVEVAIRPYGANVLISGSSGGGKSTLATAFIEGLAEQKYQFMIVDPEGDYSTLESAVVLGDDQRPPNITEVMELVGKPEQNAVVNLIGLALTERPAFFEALFSRLQEMRAKTGRPHWILIDEAHHVLPSAWDPTELTVSQKMYGVMMITLESNRLSAVIRSFVDFFIALGENPSDMLKIFAEASGTPIPTLSGRKPQKGEAVGWFWRTGEPFWFRTAQPRVEGRRHRRKYAEGELPPELSFYFRGPEDKLNLRAQNLAMFLRLAEGVDDETWLFHLHQGHLSDWFRNVIKDPDLAAETEQFERDKNIGVEESRNRIRAEIEKRYILAA